MALSGRFHRFRIGDAVRAGKVKGVVAAVVGWRECILTMNDYDATLFTEQIKAKIGDKVQDYQKVCILSDNAVSWHDGFTVERVNEQGQVGGIEAEGSGPSGSNATGQSRG